MDLTRRFVFRGNASAIAGQIYRPKTIIVDVNGGASSLGVSGGRSQTKVSGASFGDIITFGSAIIATAAATFEWILQNAVEMKSENDLTV